MFEFNFALGSSLTLPPQWVRYSKTLSTTFVVVKTGQKEREQKKGNLSWPPTSIDRHSCINISPGLWRKNSPTTMGIPLFFPAFSSFLLHCTTEWLKETRRKTLFLLHSLTVGVNPDLSSKWSSGKWTLLVQTFIFFRMFLLLAVKSPLLPFSIAPPLWVCYMAKKAQKLSCKNCRNSLSVRLSAFLMIWHFGIFFPVVASGRRGAEPEDVPGPGRAVQASGPLGVSAFQHPVRVGHESHLHLRHELRRLSAGRTNVPTAGVGLNPPPPPRTPFFQLPPH